MFPLTIRATLGSLMEGSCFAQIREIFCYLRIVETLKCYYSKPLAKGFIFRTSSCSQKASLFVETTEQFTFMRKVKK
jgi:hypothetical protein